MLTPSERRKGWILAGAFVAMVALLLLSQGTGLASFYRCPFRVLTGMSCFGCGMTRATRYALLGDFSTSVLFHPMAIPFVLGFLAMALHGLAQSVLSRRFDGPPFGWFARYQSAIWLGTLLFVVFFGLLRFCLEWLGILTPV